MAEEYWLTQARQLPFGGKGKIICCGSDPSMMINHTAKGYTGYCFRCSPNDGAKFHPHGTLTVQQILERKKISTELQYSDVYLPKDFTSDLPDEHRVWLLKGGINTVLATGYGIGYSKYYDRCILPVYKDGELDAFVARSLTEKPKYIARMRNHTNALFFSDPKFQFRTPEVQALRAAYDLVIVEDILSAIRVGRFIASCAVLGTSLSDAASGRLDNFDTGRRTTADNSSLAWWEPQAGSLRVLVWMDPDKAGRRATERFQSKLSLGGRTVRTVSSEVDPKRLSDREILRILQET